MDDTNPFHKIMDEYDVEQNEGVFAWLEHVVPRIQLTGEYKGFTSEDKLETDTPFDKFDSKCHQMGTGIATPSSKDYIDEEEELIFLINLSEHVKRPKDMLMFLGEYFKQSVKETHNIEVKNKNDGVK